MATPLERARAALAGRYRIERELGQGGMATVYLAHDERHDRRVALKVLRADLASMLDAGRFLRELRAATHLAHPHIVPLFDTGDAGGVLFYVAPHVEAETLGDYLRRAGPTPIPEAVAYLQEVSDALGCAHGRGIVHRDLKPDNVLLADGRAVVVDVGVAKAVDGAGTAGGMQNVGVAIGTPSYLAPEQVAADPHIDHRADIYALGAIAYELVTGRPPFTGPSPLAVLAAHVNHRPDPVSLHSPDVPRDLEAVIMCCLAKDPADRWQSADQLWTELGTVAQRVGGAVTEPADRPTRWHAVVVLPFTDHGGTAEDQSFTDGLTEDVIGDLARIRGLSVISRTSSLRLKGTTRDVRAVGRELGVRYALEGSVQRTGEQQLRISAQLIDALTDEQLWARKYGGAVDDVLDLREQIAREVVRTLDVTLDADEDRHLADRPIRDVQAYARFLQARQAIRRGRASEHATRLLNEAVAIEGETPALKALRVWAEVSRIRASRTRDARVLDDAEAEALELVLEVPEAPWGHALLGYVAYERGHLPQAVRHFTTALDREPNDADVLLYLGLAYTDAGQQDEARDVVERLTAADPLSPLSWLSAGVSPSFWGEAQEGMGALRRGLELDPDNMVLRWAAGYTYGLLSRIYDASDHAGWLAAHAPGAAYTAQLRALLEGMRGNQEAAQEILAGVDTASLDARKAFHLSEAFAMAGDADRALDLLDWAVTNGFYPHAFIAEHCPFLQPLRRRARFAGIAARAERRAEEFAAAVGL